MGKSKNERVNSYFANLQSTQKNTLLALRRVILAVSSDITEDIKWKNCLVFLYKDKNLIQSVLGKDKTTLIFFDGNKLNDPLGLLWGKGKSVRSATFQDTKIPIRELGVLVRQSLQLRDKSK